MSTKSVAHSWSHSAKCPLMTSQMGAGVLNCMPWRAESQQVFIPNEYQVISLMVPPFWLKKSESSALAFGWMKILKLLALRGTWIDTAGLYLSSFLLWRRMLKITSQGSCALWWIFPSRIPNAAKSITPLLCILTRDHAMHSHGKPCDGVRPTERLCCFNIWYILWGPLCDDQRWRQPWNASFNFHIKHAGIRE